MTKPKTFREVLKYATNHDVTAAAIILIINDGEMVIASDNLNDVDTVELLKNGAVMIETETETVPEGTTIH